MTISRIPQVQAMMQTKSEYDVHWHIYLAIGLLLLQVALWLILDKVKTLKPWQRKLFANTVYIHVFLTGSIYYLPIKLMSTKEP